MSYLSISPPRLRFPLWHFSCCPRPIKGDELVLPSPSSTTVLPSPSTMDPPPWESKPSSQSSISILLIPLAILIPPTLNHNRMIPPNTNPHPIRVIDDEKISLDISRK